MEYRKLGNTGLMLSALSLGSWLTIGEKLNYRESVKLLDFGYDQGINFFDTADVYIGGKTEEMLGKAFQDLKWSRDSFCVSSKVCVTKVPFKNEDKPTRLGLNRKHVIESCHGSLKRLQIDYLDFYFCHRADENTPIEETVSAMHTLVQQGKILYWGTSEWAPQQIIKAYTIAKERNLTPPVVEQPIYNMFDRSKVEKNYEKLCHEMGLGIVAFGSLAKGLLTGKYNDSIPENSRANIESCEWLRSYIKSPPAKEEIQKINKLKSIALELGISLAQLAITWCLKNPYVSSVLLGASSIEQLKENLYSLKIIPNINQGIMDKIGNILNTNS